MKHERVRVSRKVLREIAWHIAAWSLAAAFLAYLFLYAYFGMF